MRHINIFFCIFMYKKSISEYSIKDIVFFNIYDSLNLTISVIISGLSVTSDNWRILINYSNTENIKCSTDSILQYVWLTESAQRRRHDLINWMFYTMQLSNIPLRSCYRQFKHLQLSINSMKSKLKILIINNTHKFYFRNLNMLKDKLSLNSFKQEKYYTEHNILSLLSIKFQIHWMSSILIVSKTIFQLKIITAINS